MDSVDRSLQTAGLTFLTGDATRRKRKQSCGEQGSISPVRRANRLRYQESGSSSSMVTTLADARQDSLIFRRLYQAEDSSAACESADVRSEGARPPELQSVPSVDTCQDVVGQGKKQVEGRMFDQFRPFSTRSPPKHQASAVDLAPGAESRQTSEATAEPSVLDRQSCEGRGYNRNVTPWEKGDWGSKQDLRLRGGSQGLGSESVGGRSTGTGASGITKQGNSTSVSGSGSGSGGGLYRQNILRGSHNQFESKEKRRLSQEWNSASGSLSGITKDRGVWQNREEDLDDGDAQSGEGTDEASPATSAEDAGPVPLPQASSIPVLDIPAVPPIIALQGKRGRRDLEEGEERVLKNIRLEGPKTAPVANGSIGGSPGPPASSSHVLTSRRELPGAVLSKRDVASGKAASHIDDTAAAACTIVTAAAQPDARPAVVGPCTPPASGAASDKAWEMRDGNNAHVFITSARERMSDSHTDLIDVESSGRLSGYDPDTSLSDAVDGDGNLFVLSSGRTRRRQGATTASRQPTIDDEFEQYFSQMLL